MRSRSISLSYARGVDMVDFPMQLLNGLDCFPKQLALFIAFRNAQLINLQTSYIMITKFWISTWLVVVIIYKAKGWSSCNQLNGSKANSVEGLDGLVDKAAGNLQEQG